MSLIDEGQIDDFFPVDDACVLYLTDRQKSSSVWNDFSKKGNNGAVSDATLARNGFSFDGVDDLINCGNSSSLNPTAAISILVWVKPNANPTLGDIVSRRNAMGNNMPYIIWYGGGYTAINYAVYDGSFHIVTAPSNVVVGNWYHLAAIFDGSNLIIYQNLVPSGTQPLAALPLNTANTSIGATKDQTANFFNGTIGEVRIYNRALSVNEITNHYGKTRRFYGV